MTLTIPVTTLFYYFDLVKKVEDHADDLQRMMADVVDNICCNGKSQGVFTICDFGCGDGGTSLTGIKSIIDAVQKKSGQDTECLIVYQDLPSYDFTNIFLHWQELKDANIEDRKYDKVYVTSCGASFFQQCQPMSTVHVTICFAAIQYLSKLPCGLKNSIFYTTASDEERRNFSLQAQKDWESFLCARCQELKSGGQIALVSLATDNVGQYHTKSTRSKYSRYEMLDKQWEKLENNGTITKVEYEKTVYCMYFRTEEEYLRPFNNKAAFPFLKDVSVVSIQTKLIYNPLFNEYLQSDKSPDRRNEYVGLMKTLTRVFTTRVFTAALSDSRSEMEKKDILDELYQGFAEDVELNIEDCAFDSVMCFLHIRKK